MDLTGNKKKTKKILKNQKISQEVKEGVKGSNL